MKKKHAPAGGEKPQKKIEIKENKERNEGKELAKLMILSAIVFTLLALGGNYIVYGEEYKEGITEAQENENKDNLSEIQEKLDNIQENTENALNELKTASDLKEDIKTQKEEIEELKTTLNEIKATSSAPGEEGPIYTSGNYMGINKGITYYLYRMTVKKGSSNAEDSYIYFLSNSPSVQVSEIANWKFQIVGLYATNEVQQFGTAYENREDAIRYTNTVLEYQQKNNLGNVYAVNLYTGYGREKPILFRAAPLYNDATITHTISGIQTGYIDQGNYDGRSYTQGDGFKVVDCELVEILNEKQTEENMLTPYLMILIGIGIIFLFRRK